MIERFLSTLAKSKWPDLYAAIIASAAAKFLTLCIKTVVGSIAAIN